MNTIVIPVQAVWKESEEVKCSCGCEHLTGKHDEGFNLRLMFDDRNCLCPEITIHTIISRSAEPLTCSARLIDGSPCTRDRAIGDTIFCDLHLTALEYRFLPPIRINGDTTRYFEDANAGQLEYIDRLVYAERRQNWFPRYIEAVQAFYLDPHPVTSFFKGEADWLIKVLKGTIQPNSRKEYVK